MRFATTSVWMTLSIFLSIGCGLSTTPEPRAAATANANVRDKPGQPSASSPADQNAAPDLRQNGINGFPQREAIVLCDSNDLRVSICNDGVDRETVEKFQKSTAAPIEYTVGLGSKLSQTYGVTGIPHAFLVSRNGKLLWHGHPASPECDAKIEAALAEK